jgi:hypothetical protein
MFALSEFDIHFQPVKAVKGKHWQTSSHKELLLISQHSLYVHGLCILTDRLAKMDVA